MKTYLHLLQQLTIHSIAASGDIDATNDRIEKKLQVMGLSLATR